MSERIKISAKNKEQALVVGTKKFNADEDQIEVKEISPGKKNVLGMYKEFPEFEVYLKEEKVLEIEEKVLILKENLSKILACFGVLDYEKEFLLEENLLKIKLKGKDLSFLEEDEGKVLNALQYILSLMTNFIFEKYLKIVLDYEDLREKRNEKIKDLTKRLVGKVKEKGKAVTLEPMNPFERRIVHSFVLEFEGVYSKSIGKEPKRSVVIYPLVEGQEVQQQESFEEME